jgi:hypothetical protein
VAPALLDNESMRILDNLGVVSVVLLTAVTAGCRQEVESTDVRTSGVYPVVDVLAEGTGTSRVTVKLKVGGPASNTFLELTGDDQLTATAAGSTRDLDSSGTVSYAATFQTEAAGPFVIGFLRGPDDTDAPTTTVNLPEPFTMALDATEISRAAADLTIVWTAGGAGNIEETVSGSCIQTIFETIPDDGTATISRDRIRPHDGHTGDSCTVTVTLARVQSGQVDPAFTEGGNVKARQVRSVSFTSTP